MATIKSILVIGAIAASLPACRTRTAQCNDVIDTFNAIVDVDEAHDDELRAKGTDAASIEKAADAIDEKIKAFRAVDLSEAVLETARDGMADGWGKHTALMRTMAGALRDTKDAGKSAAALKTLEGGKAQSEAIDAAIMKHKATFMAVCNATSE